MSIRRAASCGGDNMQLHEVVQNAVYRVQHNTIRVVLAARLVHEVKCWTRLRWGGIWPVHVVYVADLMRWTTRPTDAAFTARGSRSTQQYQRAQHTPCQLRGQKMCAVGRKRER